MGFRGLISALVLFGAVTPAGAQTGALTVPVHADDSPTAMVVEDLRLYGSSHALVVGIDNYTNGWPRLSNAVKDARIVAEELKRHGFDVALRTDLDGSDLEQALKEFFIRKGADPQARLFLWFAGHGYTEGGEGFLVPADAPRASERAGFRWSALSMRRFGELMRLAESKHVLSVFDACFAGTIFDTSRSLPPRAITRATQLPVRQFLSAGDADQQVFDNGAFRDLFIRALRGEETADANRDGYLTASEIGLYLTDRLANLTRNRQTPRYGKLLDRDFDRGDFVFKGVPAVPPPTAPPPAPAPATATPQPSAGIDPDTLFWQSIMNSSEPAVYRAYLEAFPNGRFAPLARLRAGLQTPPPPVPPPQIAALPPPAEPVRAASPAADVKLEPIEAEYVTLRQANVREAPTTGSPQVGSLPAVKTVMVAGKVAGENWYLVEDGGKRLGYVFGNLLESAEAVKKREAEAAAVRQQAAAAAPPPAAPPAAQPAVGVYQAAPKPGGTFKDCDACPEMVVLPAGSFTMGSPVSEEGRSDSQSPQHRVTIGRPFAVGKHEVTFAQWDACVADGGCGGHRPGDQGWGRGSRPAINVSWDDAKRYVEWLSRKAGKQYRLLSEAEWEYAARAGTTTARHWGESIGRGNANCDGCGSQWDNRQTAPVGGFAANAFGLHDMLGNVWEWVEDCWNQTYAAAPTDGSAWATGECSRRVLRGGSWYVNPMSARSAHRVRGGTGDRINSLGFRVARTL